MPTCPASSTRCCWSRPSAATWCAARTWPSGKAWHPRPSMCRSEEHTSELQSHSDLVCRLLLGKKEHTSELQSHSDLVCRLLLAKKKRQEATHLAFVISA